MIDVSGGIEPRLHRRNTRCAGRALVAGGRRPDVIDLPVDDGDVNQAVLRRNEAAEALAEKHRMRRVVGHHGIVDDIQIGHALVGQIE